MADQHGVFAPGWLVRVIVWLPLKRLFAPVMPVMASSDFSALPVQVPTSTVPLSSTYPSGLQRNRYAGFSFLGVEPELSDGTDDAVLPAGRATGKPCAGDRQRH